GSTRRTVGGVSSAGSVTRNGSETSTDSTPSLIDTTMTCSPGVDGAITVTVPSIGRSSGVPSNVATTVTGPTAPSTSRPIVTGSPGRTGLGTTLADPLSGTSALDTTIDQPCSTQAGPSVTRTTAVTLAAAAGVQVITPPWSTAIPAGALVSDQA